MTNPFNVYQASTRYNKDLERMQQELWDNLKTQIALLAEQRKQMLASANQDIIQRKTQGYQTQQAALARQLAIGLGAGGSTINAIQGTLQQSMNQDISYIQANLANYMAQTQYQQQIMQRETEAQYRQYEAQKRNPMMDALSSTMDLLTNFSSLAKILKPLLFTEEV